MLLTAWDARRPGEILRLLLTLLRGILLVGAGADVHSDEARPCAAARALGPALELAMALGDLVWLQPGWLQVAQLHGCR